MKMIISTLLIVLAFSSGVMSAPEHEIVLNRKSIDQLIAEVRHGSTAAANDLAQTGDERALDPLIELLNKWSEYQAGREAAVRALAKLGYKRGIRALISRQDDQFLSELIRKTLIDLDNPHTIPLLVESICNHDEKPSIAFRSAHVLAQMKERGIDALASCLHNSSCECTGNDNCVGPIAAAFYLGATKTERSIDSLIDVFHDKPERSPLTEYVALYLKKFTGQNYGRDYNKWRDWHARTMRTKAPRSSTAEIDRQHSEAPKSVNSPISRTTVKPPRIAWASIVNVYNEMTLSIAFYSSGRNIHEYRVYKNDVLVDKIDSRNVRGGSQGQDIYLYKNQLPPSGQLKLPTYIRRAINVGDYYQITAVDINGKESSPSELLPAGSFTPTWYCFAKNTPILMADGQMKPIQEIRPGNRVVSYDYKANRYAVSEVIHIESTYVPSYLIINNLKVSEHHPFAVGHDQWKEAGELQVGDRIVGLNADNIVAEIIRVEQPIEVYGLSVSSYRNYYVFNGESFYLVHNKD